jgi:tagatose-1,6-bisphosphate aldolase
MLHSGRQKSALVKKIVENFEGKAFTHEHVVMQIKQDAMEYREFFDRQHRRKEEKSQSWSPPPLDVLKVNVDGSFNAGSTHGG